MERFKTENYLREHPSGKFPEVTSLAQDAAQRLAHKLKERMGIAKTASPIAMTRFIDKLGFVVDGVRAGHSDFSVRNVLLSQDVRPDERVFVNWYRYNEIDHIALSDLDEYFEYIWYPSADDIDIFDSSCAWILSVSHDGEIKVTRSGDASARSGSPPLGGRTGRA